MSELPCSCLLLYSRFHSIGEITFVLAQAQWSCAWRLESLRAQWWPGRAGRSTAPRTPAAQPSAYAGSAWTGNAHGSWSVSGVAWAAPPGAASGERKVLLCTCGMNGAAKAWRWDGTQVGSHHKIPYTSHPTADPHACLTPSYGVCVHCTYLHKINVESCTYGCYAGVHALR